MKLYGDNRIHTISPKHVRLEKKAQSPEHLRLISIQFVYWLVFIYKWYRNLNFKYRLLRIYRFGQILFVHLARGERVLMQKLNNLSIIKHNTFRICAYNFEDILISVMRIMTKWKICKNKTKNLNYFILILRFRTWKKKRNSHKNAIRLFISLSNCRGHLFQDQVSRWRKN